MLILTLLLLSQSPDAGHAPDAGRRMPLDKVIAGVSGPPVVSVLVAAKKPEVMLTGGEHGGEVVKWPLTVPLTFTLKDGCTYRLAKRKDGSQEYAERLESEVDFSDGGVQTVKHIVTPLATFTGKK